MVCGRDPHKFLHTHKLGAEDLVSLRVVFFCVSFLSNPPPSRSLHGQVHRIVEVLYSASLDESARAMLLSLLLEGSSVLLAGAPSRVEHTLAALQALLLRAGTGPVFRAHVLSTLTGIAIEHDVIVAQPSTFAKWVARFNAYGY